MRQLLSCFVMAMCWPVAVANSPASKPVALASKPVMAADVNVAWDASTSPETIGYRLYHGPTDGGPYPTMVDVGNVLAYTLTGLDSSAPVYVVVTAYPDPVDPVLAESGFSNQLALFLPLPLGVVNWVGDLIITQ